MTLQGHPRSSSYMSFESQYTTSKFLLVINSNLGPYVAPFSYSTSMMDRRTTIMTKGRP